MILVCGEALIDLFAECTELQLDSQTYYKGVVGGSPLNVAVGLARTKNDVMFCSEIGNDFLATQIVNYLESEGVNTTLLKRSKRTTPIAMVDVDSNGVPSYRFLEFKDLDFSPDGDSIKQVKLAPSVIHVGSYSLIADAENGNLIRYLDSCNEDTLISLDPNIRLEFEPNRAVWIKQVEQFVSRATIVKVSVEDLDLLYGDKVSAGDIANSWSKSHCDIVVLTRGQEGATIFTKNLDTINIPIVGTAVVDTVGAGDTYCSAMLSWLNKNEMLNKDRLRNITPIEVINMGFYASYAASLTCSRRGADMPYLAELPNF